MTYRHRSFINRALLRKCVAEARLLLLSSALIMFAFCWLRVWLISLFPTDRFQTIVEQFREFERFSPVPFEQLFTYSGRIALTYDELIVVMCMSVWAIGRGSDCVSGELGRGTMEMLLAQPISRLKVLVTHAVVTVSGAAMLALASWLGIYMGIRTTSVKVPVDPPAVWPSLTMGLATPLTEGLTKTVPMSDKVDPAVFWPAAVNLFALGFFLAGLSTLVSSANRYRWRTIGIVAGIYVVQLIAKITGLASEQLKWLLKWTFFAAYEPERLVSMTVHSPEQTWRLARLDQQGHWIGVGGLGYVLILIGMGLIAYVAAAAIFSRRDLPAPV